MRVAVVGSRGLTVRDLGLYLPEDTDEIISGGAIGVDTSAREYALSHGIKLTEIKPDYDTFGKTAPLARNDEIVRRADVVLAFWDGMSRGTAYTIKRAKAMGVAVRIFISK